MLIGRKKNSVRVEGGREGGREGDRESGREGEREWERRRRKIKRQVFYSTYPGYGMRPY